MPIGGTSWRGHGKNRPAGGTLPIGRRSLPAKSEDAITGLDSRLASSAPPGRGPAIQTVDPRANAEYARRMHHRQILRRAIVATTVVAVVAGGMIVGVPVARQLKLQGFLQAHGFEVDWL